MTHDVLSEQTPYKRLVLGQILSDRLSSHYYTCGQLISYLPPGTLTTNVGFSK
jgi:hypothetical protein